ncbi:MAG: HNH endonuclease signature motif containing protein [Sulfobacillus sp.]
MNRKYRGKDGRFAVKSFCYIDDKGYPRIGAGPLRGQRLHRIIAAAKLGRRLKPDEDVHHLDGNKLNFHPDNLEIMDHRDHGCVSAKQHWYVKENDIRMKDEFDQYFGEVIFP